MHFQVAMLPGSIFLISLGVKMIITAAFVVAAAGLAERTSPVIAALVMTLPVAAGPAYVFLSLDHDRAFMADSALASLAVNAATGIFALSYAALAQRRPLAISLPAALAVWFAIAVLIRQVSWSLPGALAFNALLFAISVPGSRRFLGVRPPPAMREWYDIPLRAMLVAGLVATVVVLSSRVGATLTGVLAVFPAVLTCVPLILQPRIGGPATAAVMANTQWGLIGFSTSLLTFYLMLTQTRIGIFAALALALAVSLLFNGLVFLFRRPAAARAVTTSKGA